jgi:Acyl-CoA carboxylase epsilon subunit
MTSERPEVPVAADVNVLRGNPTAEELAAVVAVLRQRTAASAPRPAVRPRSAWSDPAALLRPPLPRRWR